MNSAPWLLLGFNRPNGFDCALSQIPVIQPSQVYLALDGPKTLEQSQRQDILIDKVSKACIQENIPFELLKRSSNLGMGLAIPEALDWFFAREDLGIILEDDLYFSHTFFEWMNWALHSSRRKGQALFEKVLVVQA